MGTDRVVGTGRVMNEAAGDVGPVFLAPLRIEELALKRGAGRATIERIGMGPARATAARVRLERTLAPGRPVALLGLAGALIGGMRPGDVVVASTVEIATIGSAVGTGTVASAGNASSVLPAGTGSADDRAVLDRPAPPVRPVALDGAEDVAAILRESGLVVHLAPLASSPSIVRGDAGRRNAAAGGAVAVDMESYWCVPLARSHPFVVVRVVLDVPGRDLWSLSTTAGMAVAYRSLARSARALMRWSPVSVNGSSLQEVGDL